MEYRRTRRRESGLALAFSLALALSACKGAPPRGADLPRPEAGEVAGPSVEESRPFLNAETGRAASSPGAGPSNGVSQPAAAPEPAVAAATSPGTTAPAASGPPTVVVSINDDPKRLLGLDQTAVTDLLGAPRFIRRDEPAQMWRYRHANCVLDLFLYSETAGENAPYRVRHFEARSAGAEAAASPRSCFRALLVQRLPNSTG